MSWRHLWLRMMGRDLRRTVAFVVPTALAVMLFLLFRSLVGTAGIEASPFRPESVIDAAFAFTSYLVAFFSGFFVVYFHRLYVRGSRRLWAFSPHSAFLPGIGATSSASRAPRWGRLLSRWAPPPPTFWGLCSRASPRSSSTSVWTSRFGYLRERLRKRGRFSARYFSSKPSTPPGGRPAAGRGSFSAVWQVEAVPKPSAKWGLLGLLSLFGGYGLAVYVHPWVMAYTEYAYAVYADAAMKWFLLWVFLALIIVALVLGGTYLVLRDTLRLWVEGRRRRMTEGRGGVSSASLFLLARLGAELRRFAGVSAVFAGVFAAFSRRWRPYRL